MRAQRRQDDFGIGRNPSDTQYVSARRNGISVFLLCLLAVALLLAGLWFLKAPSMAPRRIALEKAIESVGELLGLRDPPARELPPSELAAAPARQEPPHRQKSREELRVEGLIEAAFREYFRDVTIKGKRLSVRMPFALNDEREGGRGYSQAFYLDGKGTPEKLWPYIDSVLASKGFARYAAEVAAPGTKAVVFTLADRKYYVSTNRLLVEALGQDAYPGNPTRIFVHRAGGELTDADVYNYLYAVASVGVDCSGFASHVLETVALAYGIELNRSLAKSWKVSSNEVRRRIGMWFFDPANGYTERVADRIEDLRPADMILFRGSDGALKHSAVIQSIDLENGMIRYVQSTDWAIEEERGVHQSMIRFDPARAQVGLGHYSVRWLQQVRPPFTGEEEPRDWRTDGDRYLWYTDAGGSMVVRPRFLASQLAKAEPLFYTAVYPEGDPGLEDSSTVSGVPAPPSPSRSP